MQINERCKLQYAIMFVFVELGFDDLYKTYNSDCVS